MNDGQATGRVVIAWNGLPPYAARAIGEARRRLPDAEIITIGTRSSAPHEDIERLVGGPVRWVAATDALNWGGLGIAPPDVLVTSNWRHPVFMPLAREAKRHHGTTVVCMSDNYFHRSPRQLLGLAYYRMFLRRTIDYMWVPGARGTRFMRLLGVPQSRIRTGLYTGDTDAYFPPESGARRSGTVVVGQFIERKGIPEIIAAAESLPVDERTGITLIGHGPLRPQIERSGLRFSDFMRPAELAEVYRSSSALMLASHMDHWGVVGHEAALCGCLLLATRQCGFTDDLLEHGVNGFLMDSSTPSEIVKAVRWLDGLNDDQIQAGREVSIARASKFSPQRWAATLEELLAAHRVGR